MVDVEENELLLADVDIDLELELELECEVAVIIPEENIEAGIDELELELTPLEVLNSGSQLPGAQQSLILPQYPLVLQQGPKIPPVQV